MSTAQRKCKTNALEQLSSNATAVRPRFRPAKRTPPETGTHPRQGARGPCGPEEGHRDRGSQRFGQAALVEDEWLRLGASRTSFDARRGGQGLHKDMEFSA